MNDLAAPDFPSRVALCPALSAQPTHSCKRRALIAAPTRIAMSDSPLAAARDWRRTLRTPAWISWALVVDWIVLLVIAYLDFTVAAWPPYRQDVEPYLHDPSLVYPIARPETVPVPELWLLSFRLPVAIIFAVGLVRLSLHEMHHGLLAFLLAFEGNDLATGCVS